MELKGYCVKTAGGMYVYSYEDWKITGLSEFPKVLGTLQEAIELQERSYKDITKIVHFNLQETDIPKETLQNDRHN